MKQNQGLFSRIKAPHFALNFSRYFHFEEHSVSPLLSRSESSVYKELVMGKGALISTSGCLSADKEKVVGQNIRSVIDKT